MSTFTFYDASDASTNTTDTYTINHEINLIKIAIKESVSNKKFFSKISNTLMTSVNSNITPTITVNDTNGSGAEIQATVGSLKSIDIYGQIGNLLDIPNVKIFGDGIGATAHCEVSFSINSIKLLSAVQFKDQLADIQIVGDGSGVNIFPKYNPNNYLIGIEVVATSGSGYKPETTFLKCIDSDGNEVPLTYTINFYDGVVDKVIIDNPGYNYTWTSVKFYVMNHDYNGVIADATINDGISDVTIITPGSGYSESTTLSVNNGFGTGAILTPTITNGMITNVDITNTGNSYSNNNNTINGWDYFKAWKGNLIDTNLMTTLNEQMLTVISYFQNQGYNITRMPTENGLFYWLIHW